MRTTLRKDAVPLKYVPSQEAEHDTTSKFQSAFGQRSRGASIIIIFFTLSALTEIYEDDVGDETKLNCARHSPIASSEQAQYVYLLDEEKQESTEQFALLDYSDPIVINDEDENVDSSNAMAQRKISHQPQDEWDLIDGENDDDLNSPVDSQHETESVPNKRRRSGSSGQFSEQVLSSTMRQSNETATLTNPAINYQTESVTKNIAQAISKEVTELPRTTAHPAIESHDEETLFALSLVGTLKRLPPQKLAVAKCHILTYLMQLEYGDVNAKLS